MSPPVRVLSLPALHEYRFELDPAEALSITLLNGTAEVFGFELTKGQPHPFGEELRAAVWSSSGAEIEMSTPPSQREGDYSLMGLFSNLHHGQGGDGLYRL